MQSSPEHSASSRMLTWGKRHEPVRNKCLLATWGDASFSLVMDDTEYDYESFNEFSSPIG
jgi:hypothetical protein